MTTGSGFPKVTGKAQSDQRFALYCRSDSGTAVNLIKTFGGRFLARGGTTETVAGAPPRQRTTIYVFDSIERMHAGRDAPEQKELTAIRDKSSNFRSLAVEGLPK
jgi:uncharacterized protein (DUF1330 family)